jgi:alpha-ketoglutarate-dependent taurine dioxygenase
MTQEEAWLPIDALTTIATDDRFTYYHHRRVGDVLMWDENVMMHRGAGDANPEKRRVMPGPIVYPH